MDGGILDVMKLVHPHEGLGPRLCVSDACPAVIEGLDGYLWQTDAEGNSKEKPRKVDDDAADAFRYGARGLLAPRREAREDHYDF